MAGLQVDPGDRLLILAALGDRENALVSWEAWLQERSLDEAGPSAFSLLPAVAKNLDRHGSGHREVTRLRGIYRYAWTQAQLTLRDLADVQAALAAEGVRVVAHRGAPAAHRAVGDVAALASDQTDILIDQDALDRTADVLGALGWEPASSVPAASIRSAFSWLPFEHSERRRVAVHWRIFPPGTARERDADILNRAAEHSIDGLVVLVPEPTDHLLLLAMREATLADPERARWTLEILGLLRVAGDQLDGRALSERAESAGVGARCGAVLASLGAFVADELPSLRVPRVSLGAAGRDGEPRPRQLPRNQLERTLLAFRDAGARYVDRCRRDSLTRTPWGLVRFTAEYYAHEWGARGAGGMAAAAVRRWRDEPGAPARGVPEPGAPP
jgi:hypothetical protein